MLGYLAKRLLLIVPTLLVVALISFGLVSLYPGDYYTIHTLAWAMRGMNQAQEHATRLAVHGLDKPWMVQFWDWTVGLVTRGDLGFSLGSFKPVRAVLFSRHSGLGWTLIIIITSMFWAWTLGIPLGLLTAAKYRSPVDVGITATMFFFAATPSWILCYLFFFVMWKTINPLIIAPGCWGVVDWRLVHSPLTWQKAVSHCIHLIPAWIIVGAPMLVLVVRHLRMELLDVLVQPYIETARGKGIREARVLRRHALRNAINPLLSIVGYMLAWGITGSILAARFLGMPTFAMTLFEAIKTQDQSLLTGIFMVYSVLLIIGTTVSDILLALNDPRIRYS
jgi:peptide/nickel transport system permease protein